MNLRLALAVAAVCALGLARSGAAHGLGGRAIRAAEPPSCVGRVQVFDGVSSILTCDPRGCDGDRWLGADRPAERMAGPALRLLGLKVDVNRASVEDLQALPGVGPKTAERLVAARPFHQASDLRSVSGIGPKRFAELVGAVTVDPEGRRFCADHL